VNPIVPNPALLPPGAVAPATPGTQSAPTTQSQSGPSFADVLAAKTAGAEAPTFSKHAVERLQRRGIDVDAQTLTRLTDGIQRAAGKGSRNSVVFVDGTAFVASVQNNTVITAVTPEHMREHVFTNIDSAVIA
jgi:flagellar operon protein